MPPRRSHKKSRAGCRRCKLRKIKCDEVHPRCGNCFKHGVPCDFENAEMAVELQATASSSASRRPEALRIQSTASTVSSESTTPDGAGPSSAPSPANGFAPLRRQSTASGPLPRPPPAAIISPTTPITSRLMELRLMHQYITMTSDTLSFTGPGTDAIWRDTVPHVALAGSHHLTDAILAVAALHLRSLTPNDKELVRASHAYMASSLRQYSEALNKGINGANAEALFLTSTLIAFQSTATRIFNKDELASGQVKTDAGRSDEVLAKAGGSGPYSLPLSWFHAFQGVKAITASAWPWLRQSGVVVPIIDAQAVLQLDFSQTEQTFFGHLLDSLEDEISALPATAVSAPYPASATAFGRQMPPQQPMSLAASTRQAYQHAVAVLNWAHKIPQKGAPLAFPATVSRRFVELLEERRPRALAILACFFALLKSLDGVWWLQGMARREVLGVVSLFNSDFEMERRWWPHLEWAVRVACYDDRANPGVVPPDVWGGQWMDEETVLASRGSETFVSHIEMLSQMVSGLQSFPASVPTSPSPPDP